MQATKIDESQKHYIDKINQTTNDYILYDSIYMKF